MRGLTGRCILALLVLLGCVLCASRAQITFSRDWSGGKRAAAAPAPELALDCSQFARLCRHFIHELKTAMADSTSSVESKRRRIGAAIEDFSPSYDDDK